MPQQIGASINQDYSSSYYRILIPLQGHTSSHQRPAAQCQRHLPAWPEQRCRDGDAAQGHDAHRRPRRGLYNADRGAACA